jgi:hypothetical protein
MVARQLRSVINILRLAAETGKDHLGPAYQIQLAAAAIPLAQLAEEALDAVPGDRFTCHVP